MLEIQTEVLETSWSIPKQHKVPKIYVSTKGISRYPKEEGQSIRKARRSTQSHLIKNAWEIKGITNNITTYMHFISNSYYILWKLLLLILLMDTLINLLHNSLKDTYIFINFWYVHSYFSKTTNTFLGMSPCIYI